MKIIYLRHGESVDDLTNQFGGSADFLLTPKGQKQAGEVSEKLKLLDFKIEKVLYSPLSRAKEVARIVGNNLQIQTEENIYLKEKNGYGILAGIEKEFAKEKYPELVESMSEGYVFGAEPEDQFIKRIKYIHNKFLEKNQNIIVVTHGGFINRLLENVLNKKYIKAGDCGYFIFDTDKNGIELADGIEFENK